MQLRGSIHAWSMRIISIDALIKLMIVNSSTSSLEVTEKIHTILKPFEYIKVDKIVDVLFTVTEEKIVEEEIFEVTENQSNSFENSSRQNSNEIIQKKRIESINRLSIHLGINLIKRRKTFYADQSGEILIAIAISKKYETSNPGYWYGYHLRQFNYLSQGKSSFMLFGMLDRNEVYALPFLELEQFKQKMDITESEGRDKYWHVRIFDKQQNLILRLNDGTDVDLTSYQI